MRLFKSQKTRGDRSAHTNEQKTSIPSLASDQRFIFVNQRYLHNNYLHNNSNNYLHYNYLHNDNNNYFYLIIDICLYKHIRWAPLMV